MKTIKKAMGLFFLAGVLLATGCQGYVTMGSQPTIKSVQLTEEEQQLVTAVGVERTFVFGSKKSVVNTADFLFYKLNKL